MPSRPPLGGAVQAQFEVLVPKRTSLRCRVPRADPGCLSFLQALLQVIVRKALPELCFDPD